MENIIYCSFGKDSLAQIILAYENNIKIDHIVYVEVMATKTISGEHPLHIKWIKEIAIPKLAKLGFKVTILHSKKTYKDLFFHKVTRSSVSNRIGKFSGFVLGGLCSANRDLKMKPIKSFNKLHPNSIQYVGIAIDEPKRLSRLTGNKRSLLVKYNYTEKMAYELCKKYSLLSPIYKNATRNGCWFCPNSSIREKAFISNNYPELWTLLNEWNKSNDKVSNIFSWGKTLDEINKSIDQFNNRLTIFDFLD